MRQGGVAVYHRRCPDQAQASVSSYERAKFNLTRHYRLRLTEGYVQEARQDFELQRWRACVDSSQLAVENGAKAAWGLVGPVGRTHDPAPWLNQALQEGRFPVEIRDIVAQIVENARRLGPEAHIHSDYGIQSEGKTPWELFDREDAEEALQLAEDTLRLVRQLIVG
ncbi:MAG: HEPN domain-containing protein [Thermoflexales bacterium]|nr:HEPN domain-containing protein [Thermoflexales bacterium]